MDIVIVEDEFLAAQALSEDILKAFPNAQIGIIPTESEFCDNLDRLVRTPPSAIILDMMIRWADAREGSPPSPPEVAEAGPWRAGKRCLDRLRQRGIRCPVAIYSILDEEDLKGDLGDGVRLVAKSADSKKVVDWLKSVVGH